MIVKLSLSVIPLNNAWITDKIDQMIRNKLINYVMKLTKQTTIMKSISIYLWGRIAFELS